VDSVKQLSKLLLGTHGRRWIVTFHPTLKPPYLRARLVQRNKYPKPHQGHAECERRRLRGW
jgi:hypothetical protein